MKIIEYEPSRKNDLIRLNVWWIKRYFGQVEAADREEFDHIDEEIAKGGMTFFAVGDDGEASPPARPSIAATANGKSPNSAPTPTGPTRDAAQPCSRPV